jgi:oligopeptide/dipeptide ABC transporter ATP-binding protein
MLTRDPVLSVRGVTVNLRSGGASGQSTRVLTDVSFDVYEAEILGIVGESGSGKTTLAYALLQSPAPSSGLVKFRGTELTNLRGRHLNQYRRQIQLVFQDPHASLNPMWRVREIVEEPLLGFGIGDKRDRQRRIGRALELVGLPLAEFGRRLPRELSGGQCQRVALARSISVEPSVLVLDEPVSALDTLIQAQLVNLLKSLRDEMGLSMIFISHDLALVRHISDRIIVLHNGRICEQAPTDRLVRGPVHPYSVALISSMSKGGVHSGQDASSVGGSFSTSLREVARGCEYIDTCRRATDLCRMQAPSMQEVTPSHLVACHHPISEDLRSD